MNRVPERDIIVIGGSAGALGPIRTILKSLPEDLPAAVFVVMHVSPDASPEFARSVADVGPLPVIVARHGEALEHGRVYVAPPDHHLLIGIDQLRVVRGPHENRARPAIDPTLRTASNVFDGRVIGVILSGHLNDGTYGSMVVKARSGLVIAQDPEEAEQPSMPRSLVERSLADYVLSSSEIGPRIESLIWSPLPEAIAREQNPVDPGADELERVGSGQTLPPGEIAPYSCPECYGPLWVKEDGSVSRFRCHTGHAFTGEVLLATQREDVESALWSAVRALDEHAGLYMRLGKQANGAGAKQMAHRYLQRAKDITTDSDLIRARLLM